MNGVILLKNNIEYVKKINPNDVYFAKIMENKEGVGVLSVSNSLDLLFA